MAGEIQSFQCPYCVPRDGGHGIKLPKNVGLYKVKILYNNVLIMQCQKCTKTFRIMMFGTPLLWSDMNALEKEAFRVNAWKIKKEVEKRGKK